MGEFALLCVISRKGKMDIVYLNPAELTPYDNNTKIHPPEQVDRIAESIKRFGWQQPIVVDRENVVIIGHGRLMAAKQLMLDTVPVVYADNLTEEEAQALRLADNKTNESPWDFGKLEEELAALSIAGIDMTAFGFDDLEAQIDAPEVQEVETPELPEEPKAKRGEIYQLGDHRLMCGDSTSDEDVEQLINGGNVGMIFTDPPYGIDVVGKDGHIGGSTKGVEVRTYKPVIGDDADFDPSFICKKFKSKKIFLWGANYFANKLENSGKWIVWDKNRGEGTTFSDCELCWTNLEGVAIKKYKCTWDGMRREGESGGRVHPTQKPIKLCADIICDNSAEHDTVLDLFGGSGSTLLACEQTGRKCYMMELDPHYVDVIIQRWETFTGEKAVLLNDPERTD